MDNEYNELSQKLFGIVSGTCYFAQSIIKTQCKRLNKHPNEICLPDLPKLAPMIGNAVAAFTNPGKGKEVENAILNLTR